MVNKDHPSIDSEGMLSSDLKQLYKEREKKLPHNLRRR